MSKKSKQRAKKNKAKVKLLNVTKLEQKRAFVALEVTHPEEVPEEELSTWGKLSKFMGWS